MTLAERIDQIFKEQPEEPLDAFEAARVLLRRACTKGGPCDPFRSNDLRMEGVYGYYAAALILTKLGLPGAAEALLLEWWEDWSRLQATEKRFLHRAETAFWLAQHYLGQNDKGAALRWTLYTQASDILGGHPKGGGAGRQLLRTLFGISQSSLELINSVAEKCRQEVVSTSDDWSTPAGFAEDVIRRLAEYDSAIELFAVPTEIIQFQISKTYFSLILNKSRQTSPTAKHKGDTLEDIAFYLSLLLPCCVPRRNMLDEKIAYETDLVVRNLNLPANLMAELLGRHFIIECKNWSSPIGVAEIGYFLYRMRLTHSKFGIAFSSIGITGDDDGTAARDLIRKAFHEDGNICVVINSEDLDKLADGTKAFWWMLLEKIEGVRFGNPRSDPGKSVSQSSLKKRS